MSAMKDELKQEGRQGGRQAGRQARGQLAAVADGSKSIGGDEAATQLVSGMAVGYS